MGDSDSENVGSQNLSVIFSIFFQYFQYLSVAEQILGTIMGDSDSENEGSQTNVNRLVIRPPGHTGDMELNIDEVICI